MTTITLKSLAHHNNGQIVAKDFDALEYTDKEAFMVDVSLWLSELPLPGQSFDDDDYQVCEEWMLALADSSIEAFCHDHNIDAELWEALEDTYYPLEAKNAFHEWYGAYDQSSFEESYRGCYEFEHEATEALVDMFLECTDIPEHMLRYLDHEALARDMWMDHHWADGYLFLNI